MRRLISVGAVCLFTLAVVGQIPDYGKIRSIAIGYSQNGQVSRVGFVGEDNRYHHWLEVWNLGGKNSVINYLMEPSHVVMWGRGEVLKDLYNPACLTPSTPVFGKDDYWVGTIQRGKLEFKTLDGKDRDAIKNILTNLQAAANQNRVKGLLDTPNRANIWEENLISMFQKGRRDWIKAEWVQPMTVCIRELK